ncbi:50S ribosomal protein L15 [Candidatus Bathyarchaeota archaeon]|nr:MAG: 50S ribosomal protein L15 [Candidatus Bathyarchaeota archaeon]
MPHKLRKIRKLRGSRTCGYGRVGQHRGSGSKGRRKAGRHKHGWSYVLRYEPDYFKKKKLKPLRDKSEIKTINLDELEELAYQIAQGGKEKVVLDLDSMGYDKLLGSGRITIPVSVKVSACSEAAQKKIEAAGGEILSENLKE